METSANMLGSLLVHVKEPTFCWMHWRDAEGRQLHRAVLFRQSAKKQRLFSLKDNKREPGGIIAQRQHPWISTIHYQRVRPKAWMVSTQCPMVVELSARLDGRWSILLRGLPPFCILRKATLTLENVCRYAFAHERSNEHLSRRCCCMLFCA